MASYSWVGLFALLGMLAHGAAIPRHNAIMLAAALEAVEKQSALATVGNDRGVAAAGLTCRAAAGPDAGSDTGDGLSTTGKSSACPICMSAAPAYAVLVCNDFVVAVSFAVLLERIVFRDMRMVQLRHARPPERAPAIAFQQRV